MKCGNVYSKTWKFTDINYAVASDDDQLEMFLSHSAILNGLPTDATTKISIYNRQLHRNVFEQIVKPNEDKRFTTYIRELVELLRDKMADSNNIVHDKYITVSTEKRNIEEVRTFFARVGNDLTADFGKISSHITELGYKDRLRIFFDFFRGNDEEFSFDMKNAMAKGADFKDVISPDSIEFKSDHIKIGEKYARVIFLKEYPSFLKDSMISELTDFSRNMMLSIDIQPIPTDDAVKEVQKKLLAIETDITKWQQKQNMNNNFSATIPYDMEQMRKEIKEFLDDLTTRDQRMMFVTATMVHLADTLDALNNDTETLLSIGRKHLCNFSVLRYQQEDGLNTVLPYGIINIRALRTLTTESTAVLMPYKTQEIIDDGGLYYGINAISNNLLMCNRKLLLNGNGFIIGVSGSGKSFFAKMAMLFAALFTDDDIIVVDPEREYAPLINMLGGEVIKISASTENHINALEMDKDYGDTRCSECVIDEIFYKDMEQLYYSELHNHDIQYEQKQKEIEQAKADNADFDSTQQLPDTTPPAIQNNWIENSMTQGKVLSVGSRHVDATPPIVYVDEHNAYHRGYCKSYLELTNGELEKPRWLTDVVLDSVRCADCISDKTYYGYMEAAYKVKVGRQEKIMKILGIIVLAVIASLIVYFIYWLFTFIRDN